ncbi:hypothetical protein C8J57DRAFT_1228600 [Mycena rebaudengoi]|nr:hypothetical protein C8J57DRAFT_1228600 [Mycena rebaudengoi]
MAGRRRVRIGFEHFTIARRVFFWERFGDSDGGFSWKDLEIVTGFFWKSFGDISMGEFHVNPDGRHFAYIYPGPEWQEEGRKVHAIVGLDSTREDSGARCAKEHGRCGRQAIRLSRGDAPAQTQRWRAAHSQRQWNQSRGPKVRERTACRPCARAVMGSGMRATTGAEEHVPRAVDMRWDQRRHAEVEQWDQIRKGGVLKVRERAPEPWWCTGTR